MRLPPSSSSSLRPPAGPGGLLAGLIFGLLSGLALVAAPARANPDPDLPAALAWDPAHTPLEASATLAADGTFTLHLLPEQAWTSAELTVSGDGSHALGPADGTAPVTVAGVRDGLGPIQVDLVAVTADLKGVSWSFEVQPELLPVAAPESAPAEGRKSRRARRAQRPAP